MLVPGYLLRWVLLLLRQPDLLEDAAVLLPVFLMTCIQFPVWLIVWLGLWAADLRRSPQARTRAKKIGKTLRNGLLCMAVAAPVLLTVLSARTWLNIKPAEAYEDQGVYTFTAVEYELLWERHTRHSSLHSRITGYTIAIHRVTYETADGRWQWQNDKGTQDIGKQAVRDSEQVERRVLSLVGEEGYITVDAGKTAQSYVDGQRLSCGLLLGGSLAVLAAEGLVYLLWRRKKAKAPV